MTETIAVQSFAASEPPKRRFPLLSTRRGTPHQDTRTQSERTEVTQLVERIYKPTLDGIDSVLEELPPLPDALDSDLPKWIHEWTTDGKDMVHVPVSHYLNHESAEIQKRGLSVLMVQKVARSYIEGRSLTAEETQELQEHITRIATLEKTRAEISAQQVNSEESVLQHKALVQSAEFLQALARDGIFYIDGFYRKFFDRLTHDPLPQEPINATDRNIPRIGIGMVDDIVFDPSSNMPQDVMGAVMNRQEILFDFPTYLSTCDTRKLLASSDLSEKRKGAHALFIKKLFRVWGKGQELGSADKQTIQKAFMDVHVALNRAYTKEKQQEEGLETTSLGEVWDYFLFSNEVDRLSIIGTSLFEQTLSKPQFPQIQTNNG